MDIDPETIAYIITLLLGALSIFFGEKYAKYKAKAIKFASALKTTVDAVEDDRLTPEETKAIIENWKKVFEEANILLEK